MYYISIIMVVMGVNAENGKCRIFQNLTKTWSKDTKKYKTLQNLNNPNG